MYNLIDTVVENIPFISNIYISNNNDEYITDAKATRKMPNMNGVKFSIKHLTYYKFQINTNLQNIGNIIFEIDQNILNSKIKERFKFLFIIAILGMLLLAVASYFATIFLLKPLKSVTDTIKKADADKLPLNFKLPEYSSTEVISLTKTITTMSEKLKLEIEKNMEQQKELARQEKMAFVGMMSAGLAHELKNPAMSLKLLVQTLSKELNNELPEDLQVIQKEVNRIVDTIEQFQKYSKHVKPSYEMLDNNTIIKQIKFLSKNFSNKMTIKINLDSYISFKSDKSIIFMAIVYFVYN
jgi:nitrogen fixation/metabolism regulation signal transduction histidine kinase